MRYQFYWVVLLQSQSYLNEVRHFFRPIHLKIQKHSLMFLYLIDSIFNFRNNLFLFFRMNWKSCEKNDFDITWDYLKIGTTRSSRISGRSSTTVWWHTNEFIVLQKTNYMQWIWLDMDVFRRWNSLLVAPTPRCSDIEINSKRFKEVRRTWVAKSTSLHDPIKYQFI